MGVTIYIDGCIDMESKSDTVLTNYKEKVVEVLNGRGDKALKISDNSLYFRYGTYEGFNPSLDGVFIVLEDAQKLANEIGVVLNGDIRITSDVSDYDDFVVHLADGEVFYGDTKIESATDIQLIKELEKRGYRVEKVA